ncbi:hypothetical protein N7465_003729 [Penicillium sp. CMV-2018d]|nr:hypothetical protein N7465_003729 [Penicillium sp. CMV-2018d]
MIADRSYPTLDMAILRAANNPELRLLLMLPGTITPSNVPEDSDGQIMTQCPCFECDSSTLKIP